MQACIASILEVTIDQIPEFMKDGFDAYEDNLSKWLKDMPFTLLEIRFIGEEGKINYIENGFTIITGESPRDSNYNHAVVCWNGEIVHDPHPSRDGIVGNIKSHTVFVLKDPAKLLDCMNKLEDIEQDAFWKDTLTD